jgi:hypothetical protein
MSETTWKGEPVETMHRDVLVEILRQQHFRIEALEAALNYVADMTYYSAGAEWHFKLGYDPQEVLAALAPEQEK